jgi:hypothetical protein
MVAAQLDYDAVVLKGLYKKEKEKWCREQETAGRVKERFERKRKTGCAGKR